MGNFGKSRLRKGISIVAAMVLLLNTVLPTVPVFAEPESQETLVWDYVYDEASWNAAYNTLGSALRKYYEAYPSEDLWCAPNTGNAEWHYGTSNDKVGNEYPGCKTSWLGFINAKGYTGPWVVISLPDPFSGIIEFNYNDGEKVGYPWGVHKANKVGGFGVASISEDFDASFTAENFDPSKLVVTVTPATLVEWDYVHDEASWNVAYNSGDSALGRYYEDYPSEDLWNTATNSAPGFNDKIYTAKMWTNAECEGEYQTVQFSTVYYSDGHDGKNGTQKITNLATNDEYYIPLFFDTPVDAIELFADVNGGVNATVDDFIYPCSRWIKIESVSFGGANVVHNWSGAIHADGATYPWAVAHLPMSYEGIIRYQYDGGTPVYPYGTDSREFKRGYAIRNIPTHILGDIEYKLGGSKENDFDSSKLIITLPGETTELGRPSYTSCDGDTHLEDGECMDNVQENIECIPKENVDENASYITIKTWNSGRNRYDEGACTFSACKNGFHDDGNGSCVNTIEMACVDGEDVNASYTLASGNATWDETLNDGVGGWKAPVCELASCITGYTLEEGVCVNNAQQDVEELVDVQSGTVATLSGTSETIPNFEHIEILNTGDAILTGAQDKVVLQQSDDIADMPERNENALENALTQDLVEQTGSTTKKAEVQSVLDLTFLRVPTSGAVSEITGSVVFTKPIKLIFIVNKSVKIGAKHHGDLRYGLRGLTLNPNADCSNLSGADLYTGKLIAPLSGNVEIWTCEASSFVAYTEETVTQPTSQTSYSGGGGSSSNKTETTNTGSALTGTQADTNTGSTVVDSADSNAKSDTIGDGNNGGNDGNTPAYNNKYNQEFNDAYQFAFENGITTMPTIEEADMEGSLTRIAMAKMLSNYAINVLGKTPDTSKTVSFPDVSDKLNADYGNGVTLAYQLGIMGINIDNFRPNDLVTRAEFGTALSRLLYGTADGEGAYYETHLQKLMNEGIITNNNPDLQELRGYVMIMLMRSAS